MADDHTQRIFRSNDMSRRTPGGDSSQAGNDPLAELARLIGQNDPFGEFGRERTQPAEHTYAAYEPNVRNSPDADEAYGHHSASSPHDDHNGGYEALPGYPPAHPELAGYEQEPYPSDGDPYDEGEQDYYNNVPPSRWRKRVLTVGAVVVLAGIGSAGAYGYRELFGVARLGPPPVIKADATPSKIIPPKKDVQSAKLINDRINEQGEKLVPREETPVDLPVKPANTLQQVQSAAPPQSVSQPQGVAVASAAPVLGSGVVGPDPKKVHTILIRPDQPVDNNIMPAATAAPPVPPAAAKPEPTPAAPAQTSALPPSTPAVHSAPAPHRAAARAEPPRRHEPAKSAPVRESRHHPQHEERVKRVASNAPLSLSPYASAPSHREPTRREPNRTASLTPTRGVSARVASGGYAVQVSSRRSEAEAKAAVHHLQSKYSRVLGGQPVLVRRVDLGAKGVYYRAMVGPFGSSADAGKICSSLKKAGGSCFVQRI